MKNLIVVPAYNEEEALPATIASLASLDESFEVVIVNDGSTDRTQEQARAAMRGISFPIHLVNLPINLGIGAAMQTGYLFAARSGRYEYVLQFDGDGQHDVGYIQALIERCRSDGLDLCIGSRFLASDPGNFRTTLPRRVGIRFLSLLIRLLSGFRVTDPTSGFRCAGPRAWTSFAGRYPEDYPEPESLFWCARNKLKIAEIPVRMHGRAGGRSSIRGTYPMYYLMKVSVAILVDRLRGNEYRTL
jgi:glycosyltransferase involved in cell wall biosynthesis